MECDGCRYYDEYYGYCTAMICTPISCDDPLPCEETDALTLYVKRGVGDEETDNDLNDFDDCDPG